MRPNLHVKDYVRVCELLINAPASKIHKNVFNVGYQNKSIKSLADIVKSQVLKNLLRKKISLSYLPQVMIIVLITLIQIKLRSI